MDLDHGYRLREAHSGDAVAIATVHVQSWAETYEGLLPAAAIAEWTVERRMAQWTRRLGTPQIGSRLFVVESDAGGLVGFASTGPAWSVEDFADRELSALYVLARHHGKGIGSALLRATQADGRAAHGRRLGLWVLNNNHPAIGFYRHTGATVAAERRDVEDGVELLELGLAYDLESPSTP